MRLHCQQGCSYAGPGLLEDLLRPFLTFADVGAPEREIICPRCQGSGLGELALLSGAALGVDLGFLSVRRVSSDGGFGGFSRFPSIQGFRDGEIDVWFMFFVFFFVFFFMSFKDGVERFSGWKTRASGYTACRQRVRSFKFFGSLSVL